MELKELQQTAEDAKILFKTGNLTRNEAKKRIEPYINAYNEKTCEIAKKYNQKPKKINLIGFLR